MPICPKCKREMPIVRSNSLVSDLCEECYEKERYGRIEYPMPKRFSEITVSRSASGPQPITEAMGELEAGWDRLFTPIKEQGKREGYSIVYIIEEISQDDAWKTFVQTGNVTLRCSYFFTNDKLDCIPTFEDRNKRCSGFVL